MPSPSKLASLILALTVFVAPAAAQKFYPDDPLEKEPTLWPTLDPQTRALSDILELFNHTFGEPGERHPEGGVIPAGGVNTMGDVMDGAWFENRHARHRFSPEGLKRGPGDDRPPTTDEKWRVLTLKKFGFRPGILIADSTNQLYLLRFDPKGWLEMATGADVVSSKILYALGYFVPENYIVYLEREQLALADGAESVTSSGGSRDIIEEDIENFLLAVARDPERGYRAVATRIPGSWEGLLGPYQVFGTRSDDPNDIVPHEHRRDLRGLFVFSSWIQHHRMGAVYTLDALVMQEDVPVIRHYLIDFFATLGSGGVEPSKPYSGNEKKFDFGNTFKNIAGMGVYSPRWMRARYPKYRSVGHFEYETFIPDRWKASATIAPFANRLPDDTYWAAKQVMTFTDDDIRALVSTGQYRDPVAESWIVESLIERRNRIGATYFAKVLPLDHFEIRNRKLHFEDLAVKYGFSVPSPYKFQWSRFDNQADTHQLVGVPDADPEIPPISSAAEDGTYLSAQITAGQQGKSVRVYFRKESDGLTIVGVDRDWPGKVLADAHFDVDTGLARYQELTPIQRELFDGYAASYNESTGFDLTAEDYFDSLMISERTTYDAVTHALMSSELTDEQGSSLGHAIDLVEDVERIAGQYYGRSGDQQFRLYVFLKDGARATLEKSQEFSLGHLNTVYHVGYPYSFRQGGKLPSIQFSISEDHTKADIDVDYRSSKMPAAMFNGHLTSANSDVRAGDNHERHNGRWGGFVAWWQGVFGNLAHHRGNAAGPGMYSRERPEVPTPLPPDRPREAEPDQLADATQEFLTDWLVRRKIDEALHFMSERALACADTDDDVNDEILREQGAVAALKDAMELSVDEMGDRDNLTEAIDAVLPWRESVRIVEHAYENDFAQLELTNEDAAVYLCGDVPETGAPGDYGTYYSSLFRFKREGSAILGLLWTRENGNWRIVAWEAFEQ